MLTCKDPFISSKAVSSLHQINKTTKTNYIQVTLDGSNSDLSKFSIARSKSAVPLFYTIKLSKFTPYLSNFRSLEVLYLSNQDLGPVVHISLFFTLHLSKSGVIITLFTWIAVNTGVWLGLVN